MKTAGGIVMRLLLACLMANMLFSCCQEYIGCSPYAGHHSNFHGGNRHCHSAKVRPWPKSVKV
jgi:hypothetical protein